MNGRAVELVVVVGCWWAVVGFGLGWSGGRNSGLQLGLTMMSLLYCDDGGAGDVGESTVGVTVGNGCC